MSKPWRGALAKDKVRYVGDPVAFVVAETVLAAKDAAEAVEIDIEPLPAVMSAADAAREGAPLLYDDVPGNTSRSTIISATPPPSMRPSPRRRTLPA